MFPMILMKVLFRTDQTVNLLLFAVSFMTPTLKKVGRKGKFVLKKFKFRYLTSYLSLFVLINIVL